MKKLIRNTIITILPAYLIISVTGFSQNLETMLAQKLDCENTYVPEQCKPDDIIIIINSSIEGLKFESNMLPDSEFVATHYRELNQYIICHERMRFKLTISGPNLEKEVIDIFDLNTSQLCYSITSNIAKGTINIITDPRNSKVIFTGLNSLVLSTNQPITNVSGKYRIIIVKPLYLDIDTIIEIPRYAEKNYFFDLIPLFSRIKLTVTTADSAEFIKPPVVWVDTVRIELDNERSFFDDPVQFLKFYEGDIIPVAAGKYDIKVEAEGYDPFKATVSAKNGAITTISATLEPVSGYITFVDKQYSDGAEIFVDNRKIGKVPLFRVKTRVGRHKIRFEKPGFATSDQEYLIEVKEGQNIDFDVSMVVAKKVSFDIEPENSEVFMDGNRIGFAPFSAILNAGNHRFMVRKNEYSSEIFNKSIDENTVDGETVRLTLHQTFPLTIRSEQKNLLVRLKGIDDLKNVVTDSTSRTPITMDLPYGKYNISLLNKNEVVYKSSLIHTPETSVTRKLPNYSSSSFHFLSGAYENKNSYEASFGRSYFIPKTGLSSAILNVDYNLIEINTDSIRYNFKTLAPNLFLLNWDWRIGGSIFRQLDISLLGRAKYTPGLKLINLHIPNFTDVAMQKYFYGVEISTRLPIINFCFRYGRQIRKGKINYWNEESGEYTDDVFSIDETRNIGTIGITINGMVYKSNNILRLWQNPLIK